MKTRYVALVLIVSTYLVIARAETPPATSLASFAETVCFSPDEGCDAKLTTVYNLAQKTIDVAVYDINRPELVDALVRKSKETGVQVRVVCDHFQSTGKRSAIPAMALAGVQLRYGHQKGIMHDKFSVIDGALVETGSFNYTTHATIANQENQLYTTDPKVVARYVSRFETMWAGAKPYSPVKK